MGLMCVALLAQHGLSGLLLSRQRRSCIAFRGAEPGHSSPRELCGPPCCSQGWDRRRREDKMVILDADLSALTYLLSICS